LPRLSGADHNEKGGPFGSAFRTGTVILEYRRWLRRIARLGIALMNSWAPYP
jgi:hypothetical protein